MASDTPALVAVLGREPHLSVAELAAVLGSAGDWERAVLSREAMVVPIGAHAHVDVSWLMGRLGGTQKLGELWRTVPHGAFDGSDAAIGVYIREQTSADRKVRFGYSVYDLGGGSERVSDVRAALRRGAREQKAWLATHGRAVRWVTSREPTLSSVVVETNDLLPEGNGVEVLVLVTGAHVLLARTLAVQPFRAWSSLDYGRPARDARSGMLPPKLARIMVNVAFTPDIAHRASYMLLDPFCGSGTVLTEAMRVGVPWITGTDVSAKAVHDAMENVTWMGQRLETTHECMVRQCDVRELSGCVTERVDAIVTEPYLGPPGGPRPNPAHAPSKREREQDGAGALHKLYVDAFMQFAKVLRPGGVVVFIAPRFRTGTAVRSSQPRVRGVAITSREQRIDVEVSRDVERLGFRRVHPFPEALRRHPLLAGMEDLPYARADQRVGRCILTFTYQP